MAANPSIGNLNLSMNAPQTALELANWPHAPAPTDRSPVKPSGSLESTCETETSSQRGFL